MWSDWNFSVKQWLSLTNWVILWQKRSKTKMTIIWRFSILRQVSLWNILIHGKLFCIILYLPTLFIISFLTWLLTTIEYRLQHSKATVSANFMHPIYLISKILNSWSLTATTFLDRSNFRPPWFLMAYIKVLSELVNIFENLWNPSTGTG